MNDYVIYARKSTDVDDKQALSIDSQIREVRQLAQRHGVVVSDVLIEKQSAKEPGRPVFTQLVRRIQKGQVRGLLCWKMDRLARNPYDAGLILQAQADGKLERIITSDGIKTADGNDRLMGTFELAFAAKYIDDLRANVKRGNRARFEQGWPNHLPPIGYLNDKATKTIVVDEERFPLVRRMWEALLAGKRPMEIARMATKEWGLLTPLRGTKGGKPITRSKVYRIFRDSYYAGYFFKQGRKYVGAHKPMITVEEFDRAQELLKSRARAGPVRHDNPFAGLIHCANCGCSVVADIHVKAGRRYVYHRCGRAKPRVVCRERPLSEPALMGQLAAYCGRLVVPPLILAFLRRKLAAIDSLDAGLAAQAAKQRTRTLEAIEREERELLRMKMRQLISDEEFRSERDNLRTRREDLERSQTSAVSANGVLERRKTEVLDLLDLAAGVPLVLQQGTAVQMREVLTRLHLEIRLRSRRLDFACPKPASLLFEAGVLSNWCATWPEIWKWIQFGEQATQLNISPEQLHLMMGGDERAVQRVRRVRERLSGGQPPKESPRPERRKFYPTAPKDEPSVDNLPDSAQGSHERDTAPLIH